MIIVKVTCTNYQQTSKSAEGSPSLHTLSIVPRITSASGAPHESVQLDYGEGIVAEFPRLLVSDIHHSTRF